jgi:hypothetical protein
MINDTIINEVTSSPALCNLAVGALGGAVAFVYAVGRFMIICLGFYLVYRITQIFISRNKVIGRGK